MEKSNFITWAIKELNLAGWLDKEGMYDGMIGEAVLNELNAFDKEGHSGMSASIANGIAHRLKQWKPLTPLNGTPDEWEWISDTCMQNKRCSAVFWDKDGAIYLDGYVFEECNGCRFTCYSSRIPIEFPFTVPDAPTIVKEGSMLYWWLRDRQ